HAMQSVRRRLSGENSVARLAAQVARAGVRDRTAAVDRANRARHLVVGRAAAGALCTDDEDRRSHDEKLGWQRGHDPQAAVGRRLDRRPRLSGAGRENLSRALSGEAWGQVRMNAPHNWHLSVPPLSRRADSLGTENAFVVLAAR